MENKEQIFLVTKWKLFKQREKLLWDSQTQKIYYSEVIANYKTLVLTNPIVVVVP
jgi:hypothetical protein